MKGKDAEATLNELQTLYNQYKQIEQGLQQNRIRLGEASATPAFFFCQCVLSPKKRTTSSPHPSAHYTNPSPTPEVSNLTKTHSYHVPWYTPPREPPVFNLRLHQTHDPTQPTPWTAMCVPLRAGYAMAKQSENDAAPDANATRRKQTAGDQTGAGHREDAVRQGGHGGGSRYELRGEDRDGEGVGDSLSCSCSGVVEPMFFCIDTMISTEPSPRRTLRLAHR